MSFNPYPESAAMPDDLFRSLGRLEGKMDSIISAAADLRREQTEIRAAQQILSNNISFARGVSWLATGLSGFSGAAALALVAKIYT